MIADLMRAFVEAVIVREMIAGRVLPPGWRVKGITARPFGGLEIQWSVP